MESLLGQGTCAHPLFGPLLSPLVCRNCDCRAFFSHLFPSKDRQEERQVDILLEQERVRNRSFGPSSVLSYVGAVISVLFSFIFLQSKTKRTDGYIISAGSVCILFSHFSIHTLI